MSEIKVSEIEKKLNEILCNFHSKLWHDKHGVVHAMEADLSGIKQAILALIESEVIDARIDELRGNRAELSLLIQGRIEELSEQRKKLRGKDAKD